MFSLIHAFGGRRDERRRSEVSRTPARAATVESLESRTLMSGNTVLQGTLRPGDFKLSNGDLYDEYTFTANASGKTAIAMTSPTLHSYLAVFPVNGNGSLGPAVASNAGYQGNVHSAAVSFSVSKGQRFVAAALETQPASGSYSIGFLSNLGNVRQVLPTSNPGPTGGTVRFGTYHGTATTSVFYDDGSRAAYARPITVQISAPLNAPDIGQKESNPFHLAIFPTSAGRQGTDGDFYLDSADVFDPPGIGRVLLQYWSFQVTNNGFTGVLTNNHSSEAANGQIFWAPAELVPGRPQLGVYTSPFTMYDARYGSQYQCRLTATVSGNTLSITVTGSGSALGSTLASFRTTISVSV